MTENRPSSGRAPGSALDDEDLWFPAHISAGDSFLRVTRPDGSPDNEDDGIGLPGRRPTGRGGRKPPRKTGLGAPAWLWIALLGTAAVGTVLVLARKEIAAEITQGWLKGQGVPATVKFDKLSLSRVSGTILLGEAGHPDVSVEHFDAEYTLQPFAGGGQPLVRLRTLKAVHPLVAVVLKDGKLHFGSIDKLVQSALSAPSTGGAPPESIILDDATLLLQTDYGAVRAEGDVALKDGRLAVLDLKLPKSQFRGDSGSGEISNGYLTARAVGADRLEVHAALNAPRWDLNGAALNPVENADAVAQDFHVETLSLKLDGTVPYRKADGLAAFSGVLQTNIAVKAGAIQGGFGRVDGLDTTLRLDGALKGDAKAIGYEGAAQTTVRANALQSGDTDVRALALQGPALGLRARFGVKEGLSAAVGGALKGEAGQLRQGGLQARSARITLNTLSATMGSAGTKADFKGALSVAQASVSDLALTTTTASFSGAAASDAATGEWSVSATSDVTGTGRYSGLTALANGRRDDPKAPPADDIIALDRAFERFSLRIQGLKVSLMGQAGAAPRYDIRLTSARAGLNGSGAAVLTPAAGKPVLSSSAAGGFGVTLDGPDLPKLDLTVSKFGAPNPDAPGIVTGVYALNGEVTTAPVAGARFDARGAFATTSAGGFNVTLDAPVQVSVASAELGTHVETITASVTQRDGALFRVTPSGWRVTGSYSGLSLIAPGEGLKLSGGQGAFDAFSQGASPVLGLKLSMSDGALDDAMPADQRRFNPLRIAGALTQDTRRMSGRFIASTPSVKGPDGKPLPIAAIDLDNDPLTGRGSLSFSTLDLKFDPVGLQPVYLSPLVAVVMSKDVSGPVSFNGKFEWTPSSASSGGVLETSGLNFTGAAGVSQGLKSRIVFSSLAPLQTAPGQTVNIDRTVAGIPFENLNLSVQFLGDMVSVEGASVQSPGGTMTLEPMRVPLDGTSAITGAVTFNGLDFGKIVAATNLSQNMTFEGQLTGRVPFTVLGGHITFADGGMKADAPGSISIKRAGVTDMSATGSLAADTPAPTPAAQPQTEFNPFQDLAFQAMEHLSYEQLDARINSLPQGRLNFNFHIKGRFNPPKPQKATVSIADYISGKWMQKPLNLPSGTPVELYLDIPVNLDEILNDLAQFNANTAARPVSQ